MCVKLIMFVAFCAAQLRCSATPGDHEFTFNGFNSGDLSLDGIAEITSSGLLSLTNETKLQKGRAFYPMPINFKNSPNASAFSFSTTFVCAMVPQIQSITYGLTFAITPPGGLPGALPYPYFGLFNETNSYGNANNHVVAVELDTLQTPQFDDIDSNHVGIDINGLKSALAKPAGYYQDNKFHNFSLGSGKPIQVWVEYDGRAKQMNVTLAPLSVGKPSKPLLSFPHDISPDVLETVSVGFTSATGSVFASQYVLGWSFKINGIAQELDPSKLPKLPRVGPKRKSRFLVVGVPVIAIFSLVVIVCGVGYYVLRKRKFAELLEDWELEFGPHHRFNYKELYFATKGFSDKQILGAGGFGSVYRGVLPNSQGEIAVKKIYHQSTHGMRAFIAEVVSMGRLCHRNLVPLLGYCRRKRELLLVYQYMPNGSLDRYLFDNPIRTLSWNQRFQVIKGVASALFYLHEEWEQVVVHRDIKSSNILLDSEWNGRLGDFGLARLYDHGSDPQTTHVVGTHGYLAQEYIRTGKATPSTDMFAFGAFLLEVACGRRPIELKESNDHALILVEWVFSWWSRGEILHTVDPKLAEDYVVEEVDIVLKLGLLCSLLDTEFRPSIRQVVRYLEGSVALPELSILTLSTAGLTVSRSEGFDDFVSSLLFSGGKIGSRGSSVMNSIIYDGR